MEGVEYLTLVGTLLLSVAATSTVFGDTSSEEERGFESGDGKLCLDVVSSASAEAGDIGIAWLVVCRIFENAGDP